MEVKILNDEIFLEKLNKIIRNYLFDKDIDSALFINGKWGVGKTYYWINTVEELIREIKNSYGENYEPIYISLNGISSTSEIISQIAYNVFIQRLPNKVKKNISTKLSTITVGIINSIAVFLKDKELKDFNKIDIMSFINFKNKVICFDDMERISEKISIEEVLGFISRNFLENKPVKIIVMGSENDLDKTNREKFLLKKEKVFYREIKFELDFIVTFQSLCKQLLNDEQLRKIIICNQEFFINLLNEFKIENLRTVRSTLITIKFLYVKFNKDFFNRLIKSIIFFTVVITKEFKEGKINFSSSEAYKKLNFNIDNRISFSIIDQSNDQYQQQNAAYIFYKTYIKSNRSIYNFFRSIYSFIINGYSEDKLFTLDESELGEDKKNSLLKSIEWFQSLSNQEELNKICDDLLSYIEKGDIIFYSYPYIFSKYEGIIKNNLYDKDLEQLYIIFNSGLDISFNTFDSITSAENINKFNDSDSLYIKKMKEKVNYYHAEIIKKRETKFAFELFNEFDYKTGDFQKHLGTFHKIPLFKYINPDMIFNRVLNSEPRIISLFTYFLYQKYNDEGYLMFEDIEGLESMNKTFNEKINTFNDNLKKYVLNGLVVQINFIIEELKKKKNKNSGK